VWTTEEVYDGSHVRSQSQEPVLKVSGAGEGTPDRVFGLRLDSVEDRLERRQFEPGEYLYHESQPAGWLWGLERGEIRTLKGSASGRVTALERIRRGDLFGMAAVTPGARYPESAQGVIGGEVWKLPRRVLATLLADDPKLAQALLAVVAARLQRAQDRLCSFALQSVPARLARVLLDADEGDAIRSTRRLLGESAGTTVETTIRVLRRFEHSGWIESGVGWVRLLDRAALEGVADDLDGA
jgi:CRP/FNR family transcriptional regulator